MTQYILLSALSSVGFLWCPIPDSRMNHIRAVEEFRGASSRNIFFLPTVKAWRSMCPIGGMLLLPAMLVQRGSGANGKNTVV